MEVSAPLRSPTSARAGSSKASRAAESRRSGLGSRAGGGGPRRYFPSEDSSRTWPGSRALRAGGRRRASGQPLSASSARAGGGGCLRMGRSWRRAGHRAHRDGARRPQPVCGPGRDPRGPRTRHARGRSLLDHRRSSSTPCIGGCPDIIPSGPSSAHPWRPCWQAAAGVDVEAFRRVAGPIVATAASGGRAAPAPFGAVRQETSALATVVKCARPTARLAYSLARPIGAGARHHFARIATARLCPRRVLRCAIRKVASSIRPSSRSRS